MKYNFGTINQAIDYFLDNSKNMNSDEVLELKNYIKTRFNLSNIEILDIFVKAMNKRKELKD